MSNVAEVGSLWRTVSPAVEGSQGSEEQGPTRTSPEWFHGGKGTAGVRRRRVGGRAGRAQAPRRAVCGTRGSLRTMHGGGSAPSPERPQGSPASSSVWREDPGLLSRPCRKRRPSAREDGVPRGPATSTGSLTSQRHPGKFPKVPGKEKLFWGDIIK